MRKEGVLATYRSHQSGNRLALASPRPIRAHLSSYGNFFLYSCGLRLLLLFPAVYRTHNLRAKGAAVHTTPQELAASKAFRWVSVRARVTPLITHWSYVFLELARFAFVHKQYTVMCLNWWNLRIVNHYV